MTSIEIAIAQNKEGKALVPEVCIFFENHLMRGNRTTKINAENFNAFRSFNYPVLAEAGIHIKYNNVQYDSTTESAVTKLMFLLGHGYTPDEVRDRMNRSIAGEITL